MSLLRTVLLRQKPLLTHSRTLQEYVSLIGMKQSPIIFTMSTAMPMDIHFRLIHNQQSVRRITAPSEDNIRRVSWLSLNMFKLFPGNSHCTSRHMTSQSCLNTEDIKKRVQQLSDNFMEARELLDDAHESRDTVHFEEDMTEAEDAVKLTLEGYQQLLHDLSDSQKADVIRSIGLKMEELKAQLQMIEEGLKA